MTRLIVDATIGITDIVEDFQRQIVHPPFLPSTPIQNLITNFSGITFNSIRKSTQFIGSGIDKLLGTLNSVFGEITSTNEREIFCSIVNGVIGDYLEEKENPLKITMQFRHQTKTIPLTSSGIKSIYPDVSGKILLMVHGSCMNDIQWTRKEHNHGIRLAKELNKTPIYLYYNSGRHISTNGQSFNELLERLMLNWPVPIEELIIVGHSMGGLVTRSAVHYGFKQKKLWTKHLKKIIFLGSPHQGSPLERAGKQLEDFLESFPYSKILARLGKIRSAGVTDLRYGYLVDEDWQAIDPTKKQMIPLPEGVDCYSIAACIGKAKKSVFSELIGDKLVDVKSALGQHENSDKNLNFKKENTFIAYENNHLDLLSNLEIYNKMKDWLI